MYGYEQLGEPRPHSDLTCHDELEVEQSSMLLERQHGKYDYAAVWIDCQCVSCDESEQTYICFIDQGRLLQEIRPVDNRETRSEDWLILAM
jgi:hypothetical protein